MVGDGPLRAEAEHLITSLGLEECVTLTGLRRDVPELMTAFDVFVLTSLWEGLPRVLPQAMTTGLPVVATAADGTAEIVEHGTNGFLVPKGAAAELANHVVHLLRHPEQARTMGQRGKERAQAFGAREMVQRIVDVYDDVLRAKGLA
jgi:glycosyltransferase involved in cell wall biosynthesis